MNISKITVTISVTRNNIFFCLGRSVDVFPAALVVRRDTSYQLPAMSVARSDRNWCTEDKDSIDVASIPAWMFVSNDAALIETLCSLELYVRKYFLLPIEHVRVEPKIDRLANGLETVLVNYIYDCYIRFCLAEFSDLVEQYPWVGTTAFLWSLNLAERLDVSLNDRTRKLDLSYLSFRLNELRRLTNFDVLSPQAISFLRECCEKYAVACTERYGENRAIGSSCAKNDNGVFRTDACVERDNNWLDVFKTRYDVRAENRLFDHSKHTEEAFVPFFRFCGREVTAMNMSRHIGQTMRENVRKLYRYIASIMNDESACPCVVIFNLFERDMCRMFHSKSLRQTSYVSVVKSNGEIVLVSYVLLTNTSPRVHSWFKSINNHVVKKTGTTNIFNIDSYVRLLLNVSRVERDTVDCVRSVSKRNSQSRQNRSFATTACATKNEANDNSSTAVATSTVAKKKRNIAPLKAKRLDSRNSVGGRSFVSKRSLADSVAKKKNERRIISHFYPKVSCSDLTRTLFSSAYVTCKHLQIKRTYEQFRSNDESATLVRICLECNQRV